MQGPKPDHPRCQSFQQNLTKEYKSIYYFIHSQLEYATSISASRFKSSSSSLLVTAIESMSSLVDFKPVWSDDLDSDPSFNLASLARAASVNCDSRACSLAYDIAVIRNFKQNHVQQEYVYLLPQNKR